MKKVGLLFIPIALSCISLAGCETKDYKFDNPNDIIRNRSYRVYLDYPYESKSRLFAEDSVIIPDLNNIVINNLKNVSFTKGTYVTDESNKCISFHLSSYTSPEAIGSGDFKLYDNGYINYSFRYIANPKGPNYNVRTNNYNFTFDPSIAEKVINEVYEEFDRAKVEEERFLSTITMKNFVKEMKKVKSEFSYRPEGGSVNDNYYDNDEVISEIEKLEFTPFNEESEPIDRGTWGIWYSNSYTNDSYYFDYEGGQVEWTLAIDRFNKWAFVDFRGYDCFEKRYSIRQYYSLKEEQSSAFFEKLSTIVPKLKKVEK